MRKTLLLLVTGVALGAATAWTVQSTAQHHEGKGEMHGKKMGGMGRHGDMGKHGGGLDARGAAGHLIQASMHDGVSLKVKKLKNGVALEFTAKDAKIASHLYKTAEVVRLSRELQMEMKAAHHRPKEK